MKKQTNHALKATFRYPNLIPCHIPNFPLNPAQLKVTNFVKGVSTRSKWRVKNSLFIHHTEARGLLKGKIALVTVHSPGYAGDGAL